MFPKRYKRNDEVRIVQSRRDYFHSYNQKPHRQEYLKECGKVRRLVAKYNPLYQDKRLGDRHKLNSKTRYRLKKITLWLEKNNFYLKPFSYFSKKSCNGGWNFPYIHISVLENTFLFVKEGFQPTDFVFIHLFNQQKEGLRNLRPHQFLKKLTNLKKQAQLINLVPTNYLVEPDSKISLKKPLPLNYNNSNYQEKRHAYYFLLKHSGYLWKTGMKWSDGFYRSALDKDCICQRKDIENWVKERNERNWKYLINYLKTNYQVEYVVQTARCWCSKHVVFKHSEPINSFQTYFSYYDYRQQRQRKIVTGSCQSKGKLLSGLGSLGKSLEWVTEDKLFRRLITNQENLLNILRKFYVCREPKPNKARLWFDKKTNFFIETDFRLMRKIRDSQDQILLAGERKIVQAKYLGTNHNFTLTKEGDGLDRVRLEIKGQKRDCFFNSHHRQKFKEKLSGLERREGLNVVLLGGKSLVFVDRVIC